MPPSPGFMWVPGDLNSALHRHTPTAAPSRQPPFVLLRVKIMVDFEVPYPSRHLLLSLPLSEDTITQYVRYPCISRLLYIGAHSLYLAVIVDFIWVRIHILSCIKEICGRFSAFCLSLIYVPLPSLSTQTTSRSTATWDHPTLCGFVGVLKNCYLWPL